MTDLEIVKKCAEKMGYSGWQSKHGYWNVKDPEGKDHVCCNGWNKFDPHSGEKLTGPTFGNAIAELGYDPLHDDAQAMALIRKYASEIRRDENGDWSVKINRTRGAPGACAYRQPDLNRAICECVAGLP